MGQHSVFVVSCANFLCLSSVIFNVCPHPCSHSSGPAVRGLIHLLFSYYLAESVSTQNTLWMGVN